ncbi:hypothetical protein VNO77_19006 [Canavalia gladiata]|uniref:Uncharacterized protein n=1 Tax=Canavalia gladiata TaxID=3824 RepID=A0AAN9LLW8_CANGL
MVNRSVDSAPSLLLISNWYATNTGDEQYVRKDPPNSVFLIPPSNDEVPHHELVSVYASLVTSNIGEFGTYPLRNLSHPRPHHARIVAQPRSKLSLHTLLTHSTIKLRRARVPGNASIAGLSTQSFEYSSGKTLDPITVSIRRRVTWRTTHDHGTGARAKLFVLGTSHAKLCKGNNDVQTRSSCLSQEIKALQKGAPVLIVPSLSAMAGNVGRAILHPNGLDQLTSMTSTVLEDFDPPVYHHVLTKS